MLYLWLILLLILNLLALSASFLLMPGNWMMVIATILFGWWQWDARPFSAATLIVITILALMGEIVEMVTGIGGACKAGAGGRGAIGAFIGAILGAVAGTFLIPFPIIGTLLGACLGAGFLSCWLERSGGKEVHQAVRSGMGAGMGVLVGMTAKLILGGLIWVIIACAAFWP